jgi:hypothetical protein
MVQGNRVRVGLLVAALLAVCMVGCADDQSAPPAKLKKYTELPPDFPKDVPVYPNATFQSAIGHQGAPTEQGAYLAWSTKDEIPTVRHFYTEKLDAEGWHVISYPGVAAAWMGEGGVTVVATKWGRTAAFAIGAKDGATLISLVFPGKS